MKFIETLETFPLFKTGLGPLNASHQQQPPLKDPPFCSETPQSKSLLTYRNGVVYCWRKPNVLAFHVHLSQTPDASPLQTLLFSPPALDSVFDLSFGLNDAYLCVASPQGVTVVEIPARGKGGLFGRGSDQVICRQINVGSDLFQKNSSLQILEAKWHPHSEGGVHLVVLTSDNSLRIFNILDCPHREESFYSLNFQGPPKATGAFFDADYSKTVSFAFGGKLAWDWFTVYFVTEDGDIGSLCPVLPRSCVLPKRLLLQLLQKTTFRLETLASTTYGDDQCSHQEKELLQQAKWLQDVLSTFSPAKHFQQDDLGTVKNPPFARYKRVKPQGPFLIHNLSEEDQISSLASNPPQNIADSIVSFLSIPACPNIFVLGSCLGKLSIFVSFQTPHPSWLSSTALTPLSPSTAAASQPPTIGENEDRESEEEPDFHPSMPVKFISVNLYEIINLPFHSHQNPPSAPNFSPCSLKLILDAVSFDTFYVYHPFGVHRIHLRWLSSLSSFLLESPPHDESFPSSLSLPDSLTTCSSGSHVEQLLYTCPASARSADALMGAHIVYEYHTGYYLFVLNSCWRILVLKLLFPILPFSNSSSSSSSSVNTLHQNQNQNQSRESKDASTYYSVDSSLRSLIDAVPSSSVVSFDGLEEGSQNSSLEDLLAFLMDRIFIMKQNQLEYIQKVKCSIQTRSQLLAEILQQQQKDLLSLQSFSSQIREQQQSTRDKIQQIQKNQNSFDQRLVLCLRILSDAQPVLSDDEVRFGKEISQISKLIKKFAFRLNSIQDKVSLLSKSKSHHFQNPSKQKLVLQDSKIQNITNLLSEQTNLLEDTFQRAQTLKQNADTLTEFS